MDCLLALSGDIHSIAYSVDLPRSVLKILAMFCFLSFFLRGPGLGDH